MNKRRKLSKYLIGLVAVGLMSWTALPESLWGKFIHSTSSAQSDKSLIKTNDSSTVYWLQNNIIYPIPSGDIITTMHNAGVPGWSFSSITPVSSISSYIDLRISN